MATFSVTDSCGGSGDIVNVMFIATCWPQLPLTVAKYKTSRAK